MNKIKYLFLMALYFVTLGGLSATAQTIAWGDNSAGQLGIGTSGHLQTTPVTVPEASEVTGISGGYSHTLFLRADGTAKAVGRNDFGQLGNGSLTWANSPVDVLIPAGVRVAQLSGGTYFSVALSDHGLVYAWGRNNHGQIGNGTTGGFVTAPAELTISNVVQIDAGGYHTLALKADGTVWAWGYNYSGRLGDGTGITRNSPVQVGVNVSGFENIVAVAAGEEHSMALKADGTVWTWGYNNLGQVGSNFVYSVPTRNVSLSDITQIAAGAFHSAALKADGTVWLWGDNYHGQIGKGTSGISDTQIIPLRNAVLSDIVEIKSDGGSHTLAKKRDGALWAWGRNLFGEIGLGTTTLNGVGTPREISAGRGNVVFTTGSSHNFASKPIFSMAATEEGAMPVKYFGEAIRFSFDSITSLGSTSYEKIDAGKLNLIAPKNVIVKPNAPAYKISTTAVTAGNTRMCFEVQSETSEEKLNKLRILRREGDDLVEYPGAWDFRSREVCAMTHSLTSDPSTFVIAEKLDTAASLVSVSGKVISPNRKGLPNSTVTLTDSLGNERIVTTDENGDFDFAGIADGRTYTASVDHRFYRFDPQTITVDDEVTGLLFYPIQ